MVAYLYEKGRNVDIKTIRRDPNKALNWYLRAIDAGYVRAYFRVGLIHHRRRNITTAATYWERGAHSGCPMSQHYLALCYFSGDGIQQNDALAFKWALAAANQGHICGLNSVAMACETGRGVEQSDVKALFYRKLAAARGNARAQFCIGVYYNDGLGVTKNMQSAIKWYRRAAENGDLSAACNLAIIYFDGDGVTQNDTECLLWARRAAERDVVGDAHYLVATCYYNKGHTHNPDYILAFEAFKAAVACGYKPAYSRLAQCYRHGHGCELDLRKAQEYYTIPAKDGDLSAQVNLGKLLISQASNCWPEGFAWLRHAAMQGNKPALLELANCYLEGRVANHDRKMAYLLQLVAGVIQHQPSCLLYEVMVYHESPLLVQDELICYVGRALNATILFDDKPNAIKTRESITDWLIAQHADERSILLSRRTTLQAVIQAVWDILPQPLAEEVTPHLISLTAFITSTEKVQIAELFAGETVCETRSVKRASDVQHAVKRHRAE